MSLIPLFGHHEEVCAGQVELAVLSLFVNHDLRLLDVHDALADEIHIDVVQAHRALIRAADATKLQGIPFAHGLVYVMEAVGMILHGLDKSAATLSCSGVSSCCLASLWEWSSCATAPGGSPPISANAPTRASCNFIAISRTLLFTIFSVLVLFFFPALRDASELNA